MNTLNLTTPSFLRIDLLLSALLDANASAEECLQLFGRSGADEGQRADFAHETDMWLAHYEGDLLSLQADLPHGFDIDHAIDLLVTAAENIEEIGIDAQNRFGADRFAKEMDGLAQRYALAVDELVLAAECDHDGTLGGSPFDRSILNRNQAA